MGPSEAVSRKGLVSISVHSWFGPYFTLQPFQLGFDHSADAMFVHVHVRGAHAQGAGDIFHGPLLEHVEVEHLKLLRLDPCFDPCEHGFPKVPLPLRGTGRFRVEAFWIGDALDGGGACRFVEK